ncbi:MAG: RnfABCDGE type electron transport complex subunit B [Victivallaceae bacterium]|nr:RnfABCDGE type electron transport complex subunit B [Victivallaceae bacterium]
METMWIAVAVLAGMGIILGATIGIAAKIFKVETDPRIELVTELLPGVNCGGCGKAGCADFAKALVAGEEQPGKCPVCSQEAVSSIARALGIEAGETEKKVAVVLCSGDNNKSKVKVLYNGVSDCVSASLIAGGPKGCAYGCLGMASCARACPFQAIEIINGLAVVHPHLCVGCGKCVETCPRDLVKLTPISAKVHVYCNSPEKAPIKKKVCTEPCIGCRKCLKAGEEGQFIMRGFLAEVNYDNAPDTDITEKAACPTGCLKIAKNHLAIEQAEVA